MPQSLSAVCLHAVFSTKNRAPYLNDSAFRHEMHAYLASVSKQLDCPAIEIGGHIDHIHALVRFCRTRTIADWVKETKRISSSFAKQRQPEFAWQSGYGVFSVDPSTLDRVIAYIRNQEEHHRKVLFQDELRQLMTEHGIEWNENYVWD
jgi:putative transposase